MRRATSRSRHTGMPCTARCSISRKTLRLAVFSGVGGAADGSVLPGNRPTRRVSRGPVGRDCRETSDSPCLPVSAGRDCRETFRLAVKPARGLRLPGNLPTRRQTRLRTVDHAGKPSDSLSNLPPGPWRAPGNLPTRRQPARGLRLPGNLPTRRQTRLRTVDHAGKPSDSLSNQPPGPWRAPGTFRLAVFPGVGASRLPGNLPTRRQNPPPDRCVRREPSDSPCFPGSVRRDCRETFRLAVLLGGGRPDLAHGEGATAIRLALEGHRILDCRLARPAGTGLTAMAEADGI